MPKLITFKVPAIDRKTKDYIEQDATGYVAKLYVGNYQHKFVLQFDGLETPSFLTHFASGQKIGMLDDYKIRAMCGSWGTGRRMTDRQAAQAMLLDICERHGTETVLQKLNEAKTVNP